MAESIVPPAGVKPATEPVAPTELSAREPAVSSPASASDTEYRHLVSFFKYLVTLATAFITLLLAAAGALFYSNMKDVREDAKQEATRVATSEAKAKVAEAFDEKNINALILAAAKEQVAKVTDKIIEQQLTEKLRPIEQRIALVGQISEAEMRMRMGFRSGLDTLNGIVKNATDPDVVKFGKSTLSTSAEDYDARAQAAVKTMGISAQQLLVSNMLAQRRTQQSLPANTHDIVQLIYHEEDLNIVAMAFLAFREATGATVKMFDVGAVQAWCSHNGPKCDVPTTH